MEAARHRAEVRYRRLFESAKDGILILDYGSGRIIDANPFMGELLSSSGEARRFPAVGQDPGERRLGPVWVT